ncbi:MurR/RpiR family transcriptional regulator [Streptosporangium sp. CA-135522]|uniref:MurR/RpiR family transcriptional regulator n=1 Tax=Streptosporangium sp. CA-135522 TaxID=3240072 RepID=UPI003D8B7B27
MQSPVEGIVDRIASLASSMPEAQRAIAELVLADPGAVARLTILDLADRCGVSTGSVTRLCRALGLNGYAELRLALASDSGRTRAEPWSASIGADVAEDDGIQRIAEVVSAAITQAAVETVSRLDLEAADRASTMLATARRVWAFGAGGSSTVASELQQRLYHIGVPAWTSTDTHIALSGAALLGPGDVVVAISHSGRTKEVIDLVTEAMIHGAATIAICNDPASPLAARAELTLLTRIRQTGFRTEALATRHGQLAVVDVLFIAVAQRTFEQAGETMAAAQQAVQPYKEQGN